jgi:hypothetical protein
VVVIHNRAFDGLRRFRQDKGGFSLEVAWGSAAKGVGANIDRGSQLLVILILVGVVVEVRTLLAVGSSFQLAPFALQNFVDIWVNAVTVGIVFVGGELELIRSFGIECGTLIAVKVEKIRSTFRLHAWHLYPDSSPGST